MTGEAPPICARARARPPARMGAREAVTVDNLLSGLVGGVVGGALGLVGALLAIGSERKRYRRENKGAAQLVLTEVLLNIGNLDDVTKRRSASSIKLLSVSIWEAERVRVATLLDDKAQIVVTTAFQSVAYVSRVAREIESWNAKGADTWVQSKGGRYAVIRALVMMRKASEVLNAAAPLPEQGVAEWERETERVEKEVEASAGPAADESLQVRVLRVIEEVLKDRHPDQRPVDTGLVLQRMRLGPEAEAEVAEAMSQLVDDGYVRGPRPLRGDNQALDVTVTAITERGFKLLSQ